MKTYKLYFLFLVTLTLILMFSSSLKANGTERGGGVALVGKDGKVYFLDLVDPKSKKDLNWIADSDFVNKKFFNQRWAIGLGEELPEFFKTANEIFSANIKEFPVLQKLEDATSNILPYLFKARIHYSEKAIFESPSFQGVHQESLATYNMGTLLISKLYNKLSKKEQTALAIHESLRHLNCLELLAEPLMTQEIEVLTRYFMKSSFPHDDIQIAVNKLKNLRAQRGSVVDKVFNRESSILKKIYDPESKCDPEDIKDLRRLYNTFSNDLLPLMEEFALAEAYRNDKNFIVKSFNSNKDFLVKKSKYKIFDLKKIGTNDIFAFISSYDIIGLSGKLEALEISRRSSQTVSDNTEKYKNDILTRDMLWDKIDILLKKIDDPNISDGARTRLKLELRQIIQKLSN